MLNRWALVGLIALFGFASFHGVNGQAFAEDDGKPWVSKVISLQGRAMVNRQGQADWAPVRLNDILFPGDRVRVEANSRAGIVLRNDAVLRLDQNTTLVFTEIEQQTTFIFKLLNGAANFFSRRPRSLKIFTPFVNGVVEGTEFYVQVDSDQTRIDLFEGRILAENQFGELQLSKGQGAVATSGSAPQHRILAKPRDSVQWALYYPPVLALEQADVTGQLKDSLDAFNQGRPLDAIDALEQTEEIDRDSMFYAYRAGLLLHLGRVIPARNDLQQALASDPDNGEALAMQAIIAVVQNRKEEALSTAQKAVRRAPSSAAAHIALSYAQQAAFNLTEALDTAQAAVTHAPESSTARARLAELYLSIGELDKGVEAARKAVALNPREAHAHTMLGYAYLTQIKTDKAKTAFEQAITLDSVAPLPRLGLGLAKIREGDLAQGRAEIEIAAGLDPANALIRSYLGKAYFDEKRGGLDKQQLEIAKRLDPNDPTPWHYDAIRKHSLNRPVEALQDLQTSIELNDNRAVYRSRLLLDEDLAARSASLGRIFSDLDFQHLALTEGYKSLNAETTNYSAHKLLADSYAIKPRHEVARVSQLLQAQLFQPLNLTPLQAHLNETDTLFFQGSGPAELSFNEYNPLFTRNRIALQASGIYGSNKTWGNEITGSGIYDKVSLSISELYYHTDGFRKNNDFAQGIVDLFFQSRLTPNTNFQAEYRYSQSENGDLSQNFDGLFSEVQRDEKDLIKTRLGAHHRFSPAFEVVASYIHMDESFEQRGESNGRPSVFKERNDGDLYEVRADYSKKRFGLVTGLSVMDGRLYEDLRVELFPGFEAAFLDNEVADSLKEKVYAYSNVNLSDYATVTIGLSAVSMKVGSQIEREQLNPKLALTVQPSNSTTLRLAAFRALSSTNVFSQTTEPVQVGGFNQFFDDLDASDVRSYGLAVDHKFSSRLFGGIEYLRRDLEVPLFQIDATVRAEFFDWNEYTGLAYLYWAPCNVLSLRAEYQYERFDRRDEPLGDKIVDVETHRIPLSLSYFSPLGFSFRWVATYIFQEGEFESTDTGAEFSDGDTFWVVDAELSYRLPKRLGVISVGIKNMFDEEINYADTDPSNPAVVPGLFAYGKITLSF